MTTADLKNLNSIGRLAANHTSVYLTSSTTLEESLQLNSDWLEIYSYLYVVVNLYNSKTSDQYAYGNAILVPTSELKQNSYYNPSVINVGVYGQTTQYFVLLYLWFSAGSTGDLTWMYWWSYTQSTAVSNKAFRLRVFGLK